MSTPSDRLREALDRGVISSHTDLSEATVRKNERKAAERVAREAAESQEYLTGRKTLGPVHPTDEQIISGEGIFQPREYGPCPAPRPPGPRQG